VRTLSIVTMSLFLLSQAVQAQTPPPAAAVVKVDSNQSTARKAPKLIVAISVDQFSADLFTEYRPHFSAGLKRLSGGAVFPAGYQAHAATETCPGHATILTGAHPARSGIVGNRWIDLDVNRDNVVIYCAEDERVSGTEGADLTALSGSKYVPSAWHLLVPTLGERLKGDNPASRNIAISGKDRSALMMAGSDADEIYWWRGKGFETHKEKTVHAIIKTLNDDIGATIDNARAPDAVPEHCVSRDVKLPLSADKSIGDYRFARPAGGHRLFRISPDLDHVTMDGAAALVKAMNLGQGEATDILSIGLSATDYIGHVFGTGGLEMCIQLAHVDAMLERFFGLLDEKGIEYVVVLTADHGGHDAPERLRQRGAGHAARVDPKLNAKGIDAQLKEILPFSSPEPFLYSDGAFGDYYVSLALTADQKAEVKLQAMKLLSAHRQVAEVLDTQLLRDMPLPSGPFESWTLAQRARASYHPERSGDFVVLLKNAITPIADISRGYVATHGSPWDYDRRVPILFWQRGLAPFEHPLSVSTVDIVPTLAGLIGFALPEEEMDGRCLDLDQSAASTCPE